MRRKPTPAVLAVAAVALVALLIWGGSTLSYASTHETTDDARIDADTVVVTSKIPERVSRIFVDTNQAVSQGQILMRLDDADERVRLEQAQAAVTAQQAQARAAARNVTLTDEQQHAQENQGGGGVRAAEAQILNARAMYAAQQQAAKAAGAAENGASAQLRVAQAQVPSAAASLARAQAELARAQKLASTGDTSQQQLDAAVAGQAQALAQFRAAQEGVAAAQTNVSQAAARNASALAAATAAGAGVGAVEGQLATAQGKLEEAGAPSRLAAVAAQANAVQAQVSTANAQLDAARNQLGYTLIRAPIAGIIGAKNVEIGASVGPGQPLFAIVPQSRVYITANYKETQLDNMRIGQAVDVRIDAYKSTRFRGRVDAIGPATQSTYSVVPAQNATGNFVKVAQRLPVRITVIDPPAGKPLRVGMSAVTSVIVR